MQQMQKGDFCKPRVHGFPGQRLGLNVFQDRVIQLEFARLGKHHDSHGGDGLGKAGDSKQGLRAHRFAREALVLIGLDGPTEPGGVDKPVVLDEGKRGSWDLVFLEERKHQLVKWLKARIGFSHFGKGRGYFLGRKTGHSQSQWCKSQPNNNLSEKPNHLCFLGMGYILLVWFRKS